MFEWFQFMAAHDIFESHLRLGLPVRVGVCLIEEWYIHLTHQMRTPILDSHSQFDTVKYDLPLCDMKPPSIGSASAKS